MKGNLHFKSVTALALSAGFPAALPAHPPGPNILIIYTDDMGIGDVSFLNDGWVHTPNIDRLAAGGLVLRQYYSAAPVSSASRAGLTTGQYPLRLGINTFLSDREMNTAVEQFDWLDPGAPSMARTFGENGYATAHIGKWHLGGGGGTWMMRRRSLPTVSTSTCPPGKAPTLTLPSHRGTGYGKGTTP